jgi:hypothetical protein
VNGTERPPRDLPPHDFAVIRSVGELRWWNGRRWRWDGREWQPIERAS